MSQASSTSVQVSEDGIGVGGTGVGVDLSERDYWISEQVGPVLKEKGILFAGLDVIGDYLTEINVTSPTGVREIAKQTELNLAAELMDWIEQELTRRRAAA